MTRKRRIDRPEPEPDDFMFVTIGFDFRVKENPSSAFDPPPIQAVGFTTCLPAEDATADYLETVAKAIRERRLYGWCSQETALCSVSCEEWIAQTYDDMFRESKKEVERDAVALGIVPPKRVEGVINLSDKKKTTKRDDEPKPL